LQHLDGAFALSEKRCRIAYAPIFYEAEEQNFPVLGLYLAECLSQVEPVNAPDQGRMVAAMLFGIAVYLDGTASTLEGIDRFVVCDAKEPRFHRDAAIAEGCNTPHGLGEH
jgi:hypothetical protein